MKTGFKGLFICIIFLMFFGLDCRKSREKTTEPSPDTRVTSSEGNGIKRETRPMPSSTSPQNQIERPYEPREEQRQQEDEYEEDIEENGREYEEDEEEYEYEEID